MSRSAALPHRRTSRRPSVCTGGTGTGPRHGNPPREYRPPPGERPAPAPPRRHRGEYVLACPGRISPPPVSSCQAKTPLKEIPVIEEAGILCRIPNWWKKRAMMVTMNMSLGQCILQRHMVDPSVFIFRCIGCEKCKRKSCFLVTLHKMEKYTLRYTQLLALFSR